MPARFMARKPEFSAQFFAEELISEYEDRVLCARVIGAAADRPVNWDAVAQHVHDLYDHALSTAEQASWQAAEASAYDELRSRGLIS